METSNQPLQNGTTEEVPYTKHPRFLGPPIKMGEIVNGDGNSFLPLGAGGPAPPIFETCEMKIETPVYEKTCDLEPETPHVRFLGESPNLTDNIPAEDIQEIINGLEKCQITEKSEGSAGKSPKQLEVIPPGPPRYVAECLTSSPEETSGISTEVAEENKFTAVDLVTEVETTGVTEAKSTEVSSNQVSEVKTKVTEVSSNHISEVKNTEVTEVSSNHISEVKTEVTEATSTEMKIKVTEVKSSEVTEAKSTEVIESSSNYDNKEITEENKVKLPEENTKQPVMKIFECFVGMEAADKKFGVASTTEGPADQSLLHETCTLKSLPPLRVDKLPEEKSGSTPPNTPLTENAEVTMDDMFRGDPARIPLGAGGPSPSICHPLSKDGVPAQSPPRFPVPSRDDVTSTQVKGESSGKEDEDEGIELRDSSRSLRDKVKSLPPEVAKKPARGAIARLASVTDEEKSKPLTGLSIAAPRRSHSFIGFSSPSLASSVAGSVHAHRQQFLQRRMLFEQPQEVTKPTLRKFQIELKALKLGKKSLCDSWVTEEKEEVQTSNARKFQRTPLRASFIHRRSTENPLLEDEDKKEEKK